MSSSESGAVMGAVAETEERVQVSPGKVKKSWKGVFAVNICIATSLLKKW